jgi:hypothetical protein
LDIWVLPLEDGKNPRPFIATPFDEAYSKLSPDGTWVAYQSNESGRDEVYVQPYPGPGGKSVISIDGGSRPFWSPDGKELFYWNGNQLLTVLVQTKPALLIGRPRVLFEGAYSPNSFGITPDGQQFLMVEEQPITHVSIILNWFEELKRRVPTN